MHSDRHQNLHALSALGLRCISRNPHQRPNSTSLVEALSELRRAFLVKEKKRLCNISKCCICFANSREVCFIPCRHATTCTSCSSSIKECPIRRTPIQSKVVRHFQTTYVRSLSHSIGYSRQLQIRLLSYSMY